MIALRTLLLAVAAVTLPAAAAEPERCPPAERVKHQRPASGENKPENAGKRAHTNVEIATPPGRAPQPPPASLYGGNDRNPKPPRCR